MPLSKLAENPEGLERLRNSGMGQVVREGCPEEEDREDPDKQPRSD